VIAIQSEALTTDNRQPTTMSFKPYVAPDQQLPEFTWRGWLPGILLGIVFGVANAYLGLRAGLTISTSSC
jgi:uncharacterized oligopeptide transporter (OPT) family protein